MVVEEENTLKDSGNWFDIEYISVEVSKRKVTIPDILVGANPLYWEKLSKFQ